MRLFGGMILAIALLCSATVAEEVATSKSEASREEFRELFNGRDLTGWEGAPDWWQVRDGLLVCESTAERPCTQSHYLFWTGGEPADFELRVVYRIAGPANTGVQFRSERRENFDTWGYQADIDMAGEYTGCLYQHDRGLVANRGERVRFAEDGTKSVETFEDSAKLLETVKADDWNEYRIRAEGPKVTLWINDTLMCEVEDYEKKFALPRGVLALQMHQGPPMKVEFKSVKLLELDSHK